ncbi:hypothetical protein SBADM41S_11414 [Streptomyces badius]
MQQSGEADDLDRDVPGDQGGLDLGEVPGGAAQNGDLAGRGAGAHEVGEGVGEPVDLLGVGAQQGAADHAVALGARRGAQRLDALVHRAQRFGEAVGELEETAAAAPVLAEAVAGGGGAVGVREVLGEVVQVGDGRAAPAVDRLAGIAHGGHRVAARSGIRTAAEQRREQQPLGHRRVLVLVEEDDPELLAQDPPDLGPGQGQLGGERDLVAEVQQVPAALGGPVPLGEAEERAAGLGGLGDLAQVGVAELGGGQVPQQFGVVRLQRPGPYEVFGQFTVEREQIADQRGEGAGERRIRARGLAQHLCRQLVARGVGEEAGGGLQADAQAVLGEETAGERVVGGDGGLARGVVRVDDVGVGDPRGDQRLADALGQLARRLVGEGEAEDLFGRDLSGADQPDHAGGHHRGLARPGSGHDHLRGGRRDDAGRLLRGERNPEELLELLGIGDAWGHPVNGNRDRRQPGTNRMRRLLQRPATGCGRYSTTCRPSGCALHEARKVQWEQCVPVVGVNRSSKTFPAAVASRSKTHSPASGSCAWTLGKASPPSFLGAGCRSWTSSAPPGSGRLPSKTSSTAPSRTASW